MRLRIIYKAGQDVKLNHKVKVYNNRDLGAMNFMCKYP